MTLFLPTTALFYITNQCNLSCRHCSVSSGPESIRKNELLNEDGAVHVVGVCQALGLKSLTLTGGEAFLREDLGNILERSKANCFQINIDTNLTYLPQYTEKIISEGLFHNLHISIDGATPKSHNFIRGNGSFEQTINNIHRIQNYIAEYKKENEIKLALTTVITNTNHNELKNIISLAKQLQISKIKFEQLVLSGRAKKNEVQLAIKGEKLLKAYENIMSAALSEETLQIKSNMFTNIFIEHYNKKFQTSLPFSYYSCTSPQQYIYISYDGTVVPCAIYTKQSGYSSWSAEEKQSLSIINNNFEDILWSRPFKQFFESKTSPEIQNRLQPCNVCKFHGNLCMPCISNVLAGRDPTFELCKAVLESNS